MHFSNPQAENLKPGTKNLDLNKIMQNIGSEQFDYGMFKAAYDTDPRVKSMIKDFDKTGITPKTANTIDDAGSGADRPETDAVGQMAQRATNLGDRL